MKLRMPIGSGELEVDMSRPIDIGIPVQRTHSVSSFQIAGADYRDYEQDGFVGNVQRGGSCNLETITFTAHGNGSHTECVGHIAKETYYVNDCVADRLMSAQLVSTTSVEIEGQHYLDLALLRTDLRQGVNALVIRTLPNSENKKHRDYSGTPTPAVHPDDMRFIVAAGIRHLLVDLPSVDPEWDGGALASHHIFWNYPEAPRTDASITEFIFVPDQVNDGLYALQLNIGNFISDAAPSKPYLYPRI